MKYLPLILRNLFRNRRRTILSVLSIGISMFIFSALMSLPSVVRELLRDRTSNLRLDCANKAGFGGFDYTLPFSYGDRYARCRMSTRSAARSTRSGIIAIRG